MMTVGRMLVQRMYSNASLTVRGLKLTNCWLATVWRQITLGGPSPSRMRLSLSGQSGMMTSVVSPARHTCSTDSWMVPGPRLPNSYPTLVHRKIDSAIRSRLAVMCRSWEHDTMTTSAPTPVQRTSSASLDQTVMPMASLTVARSQRDPFRTAT